MISPAFSVLFGELVLSLYPILIKTVHTNLFTQLLARFIVFPVLAIAFGSSYDFHSIWSKPLLGILTSLLNVVHIAVSYGAFKILPVGTSISLFYLYPLFNIIAGALFFGEPLSAFSVILILVAFIGAYLIATSHKPSSKPSEGNPNESLEKSPDSLDADTYKKGVGLAIMAALTETMIFMFVRSSAKQSPFYAVNHLYPAGLIALGLYGLTHTHRIDMSSINWTKLIGFNALLGFTGYIARFYAIPHIPILLFSLLSFFGVSFGYLWGVLFTKDEPTTKAILGSGLIAAAVAWLRYFG